MPVKETGQHSEEHSMWIWVWGSALVRFGPVTQKSESKERRLHMHAFKCFRKRDAKIYFKWRAELCETKGHIVFDLQQNILWTFSSRVVFSSRYYVVLFYTQTLHFSYRQTSALALKMPLLSANMSFTTSKFCLQSPIQCCLYKYIFLFNLNSCPCIHTRSCNLIRFQVNNALKIVFHVFLYSEYRFPQVQTVLQTF